MALQFETIPFTLRTGTGTQTISHVVHTSMEAQAVIFFSRDNVSATSSNFACGIDDETTHIGTALGAAGNPFASTVLSARGGSNQYSLYTERAQAFAGGAVPMLRGYVSRLAVGEFDITLDVNDTPGANWIACIIGGSGVQCQVGSQSGSGTVTVGFPVVAVIKVSASTTGATFDVAGGYHSYGFATPCGPAQVAFGVNASSSGPTATNFQLADQIQADILPSSTTVSDPVIIDNYTATGFDVTVSGTPDFNIGYLAIGGTAVSANLVAITQPTTTGVQNIAIDATDPVAVFLTSTNYVATSGAGNVDADLSYGVYDGVTNNGLWWSVGNFAGRLHDQRSSTSKSIVIATVTGDSTSTLNAEASCTLASENIALNWTTADAVQREIWALVLAQNLTGSTNECGINPQASITVFKQCTPIAGGETEFAFGTSGGLTPSTFTLLDGESELFASVTPGTYGITETPPAGWSVSYAVSTGDPHTAIDVGSGEAVTVTVTNTFQSTEEQLLRLRRWALPYDGNKQIFIPRIEIISQMGVGNGSDPTPVMYLRISPDGGSNFGPWRQMPLGAAGDTTIRSYLTRFGQLRNPVAELICTAPVFVGWIRCELPQDFTVGSS